MEQWSIVENPGKTLLNCDLEIESLRESCLLGTGKVVLRHLIHNLSIERGNNRFNYLKSRDST